MNDELEAAKLKAEKCYNTAADHYDDEPLGFWERYGRRTVERLELRPGSRVLDVCCGAGASALPAARIVGPDGSVLGVDLAVQLLALAYAKMEAQVTELWRMVRPGGQLAITTWGPDFLAPGYEVWLTAIRRLRPDLPSAFTPWERLTMPTGVTQLFANAGIADVDVVAEEGYQPIRTAEDFWAIALGSGIRWTIEQMGPETADAVKREVCAFLTAHQVDRLGTHVNYAVARKGLVTRIDLGWVNITLVIGTIMNIHARGRL